MSFHEAFAQALFAPGPGPAEPGRLAEQPAFAVYRNTVMKGCIDALQENFPTVERLVGNEWFRTAAALYVSANQPRDGRLLAYGDDGFADFVQALPTARELPYLADVGRMDALFRACAGAADAPVLPAHALAGDAPEALGSRVLRPHAATRWAWFGDAPIASIWLRHRTDGRVDHQPLEWRPEGALFTRPDGAVQAQVLSAAGCAFLDACSRGMNLGEAAGQALQADEEADLAALLGLLLAAGAFADSD